MKISEITVGKTNKPNQRMYFKTKDSIAQKIYLTLFQAQLLIHFCNLLSDGEQRTVVTNEGDVIITKHGSLIGIQAKLKPHFIEFAINSYTLSQELEELIKSMN